jgi:hydrogenase expression/formation protein HypC
VVLACCASVRSSESGGVVGGSGSSVGKRPEGDRLMCLAIPGRVVEVADERNRLAKVDVSGVLRNVNVGLLDDVEPNDWVLIHVGFALSKVDEDEAHATLALLQEMGAAYEQELEDLKTSVIE